MRRFFLYIALATSSISFLSCISINDLNPPKRNPNPSTGVPSSTTANCYIVSSSGTYDFPTVRGGSTESVGDAASVEIIWESFGTDVTPAVGDLIESVSYSSGKITYTVASPFKEGNAVIAAKDASGAILWSWHIWLTDYPQKQVYANNAGTMMDRNLGATSSAPGDVAALGLLYQWGRKDPFLGSSSISEDYTAKSTAYWPSPVESSASKGTIAYAVANPMTFITGSSSSDYDWHFASRDNELWKSSKSVYDPCPVGWRVPDGGSSGIWSRSGFEDRGYDDIDKGMQFGAPYCTPVAWYPASGWRRIGGWLGKVGDIGVYWSVSPDGYDAYNLCFNSDGDVSPSDYRDRAVGQSVRCLQE